MKGKRVMGMVNAGALSTLIYGDIDLMWDIPDGWSFEDAATVPVVYGTVSIIVTFREFCNSDVL